MVVSFYRQVDLGSSSKNTPVRNCLDRGGLWTCVSRIILINGSWETLSECDWVHSLGWGLNCVRVERAGSLSWFFLCSCLWTRVFRFLLWLFQSAGLWGADEALGECVLLTRTRTNALDPWVQQSFPWGEVQSHGKYFFPPLVYGDCEQCMHAWVLVWITETDSFSLQPTSPRAGYNKHECAGILAVVGCLLVDVAPSENARPT